MAGLYVRTEDLVEMTIYTITWLIYVRTEGLVKLTIYTITWLAFMLELKVWWK